MSITFSSGQVTTAFKLADVDGDGQLSKNEVKAAYEVVKDGETKADKEIAGLLETIGKLGQLMSKIDGEAGLTKSEIKKTMALDGEGKDLSEDDAKLLAKKMAERSADTAPSPTDQFQRQQQAMLEYRMGGRQPWVSHRSPYQANGGTSLPPGLQGTLANATAASMEATSFMGQLQAYQMANGQYSGASNMTEYYTGVNISGAGEWSPLMMGQSE